MLKRRAYSARSKAGDWFLHISVEPTNLNNIRSKQLARAMTCMYMCILYWLLMLLGLMHNVLFVVVVVTIFTVVYKLSFLVRHRIGQLWSRDQLRVQQGCESHSTSCSGMLLQAVALGSWLRRRYVGTGNTYSSENVLAHSTNYRRTRATMHGVLLGLFPGAHVSFTFRVLVNCTRQYCRPGEMSVQGQQRPSKWRQGTCMMTCCWVE